MDFSRDELSSGGIFAFYKPKGPTSNAFLNQIRRLTGVQKIGHAGTLDPLAAGVLVVGIGAEFTKQLHDIVGKEKEYIAKIKFGYESSTDDEEGEKKEVNSSKVPSLAEIESALSKFIGDIKQVPPAMSAAKVRGEEAYKRARRGEKFSVGAHSVEIKTIKILDYDFPYLTISVITGPGVYIRSLARDLGHELKTGAYLADLERIRVGDFTAERSVRLP
jgi:tRNA pseudouridine55 synthase